MTKRARVGFLRLIFCVAFLLGILIVDAMACSEVFIDKGGKVKVSARNFDFPAGGERAIPMAILSVKAEYLDAAFDEIQKKYGTIENYFSEALGIDAAGQKALRDLYLERK